MRANTLHTLTEWKQIAGELPIKVLKRGGLVQSQEYIDSQEQYLRKEKDTFASYIQASQRKTRQGILLNIIQSDAPSDIVRSALYYYRGFRSGFKTIVRMIEKEQVRLYSEHPIEDSDSFIYHASYSTISPLVELLGWMRTDESHSYLMHLATEGSHPMVQIEAIDAMAFEKDKFDPEFIIEIVKNPASRQLILYNALWCMLYNNVQYKCAEFCAAIWPHVQQSNQRIWQGAIEALATKFCGRQGLRRYLLHLKSDLNANMVKVEYIESELHGYEEDDAATIKKLLRRKNQDDAPSFENSDD